VVDSLVAVAFSVGQSLLLTPYLIAIHRFILVGEVARHYAVKLRDPRFLRFFGWTLTLSALYVGVGFSRDLLLAAGTPPLIALACAITMVVFVVIVGLRLTILFPAIAVDAPRGTASNAFADTNGHALDLFFIFILAEVPVAVVVVIVVFVFPPSLDGGLSPSNIVATVLATLLQVFSYALLVAIASRAFQALAERVRGHAPLQDSA
jgi:hypothetical protein